MRYPRDACDIVDRAGIRRPRGGDQSGHVAWCAVCMKRRPHVRFVSRWSLVVMISGPMPSTRRASNTEAWYLST